MQFSSEIQKVLDHAPVAILICDPAGLTTLANRQAEELFGYQPGELNGASIESLLPKDWCEIYRTKRPDVLPNVSAPSAIRKETTGQRKDGSQVTIEIGANAFSSGEQAMLFISDISKRKIAEEELQLFSRAVEQSIASVIITNAHSVI